jgi:hypothetical protein
MVVTGIQSGGFDGSLMHHARQRTESKRSVEAERGTSETKSKETEQAKLT